MSTRLDDTPAVQSELPNAMALRHEMSFAVRIVRAGVHLLNALCSQTQDRRRPRRLRVAETISLGEKRFVSVLEVDGVRLLLGGSSTSIVLLAELRGSATNSSCRFERSSYSVARTCSEVPIIGNHSPGEPS